MKIMRQEKEIPVKVKGKKVGKVISAKTNGTAIELLMELEWHKAESDE